MIGCYSPYLDAEGKFMAYRERFKECSDEKLLEAYEHLSREHAEDKSPSSYAFVPEGWHQARAVVDLLRERRGEEYVKNLTKIQKPKTLVEKLVKFFV